MRPIYRCRGSGVFVEDPGECRDGAVLLLSPERRVRLSKLMSGLLRHFPWEAGLRLDGEGWVPVVELVRGIRERWRNREAYSWVTVEHVVAVALLDPKGRFQLSPDLRMIRAAYGHSREVGVRLGYRRLGPGEAPERLYHGTVSGRLPSILEKGLLPMRRVMVHLSSTVEDALEVARRHGGDPVVLVVDTRCLLGRGVPLYRASSRVYLAPWVPPDCLKPLPGGER